tara:strand:+ start:1103 stop:2296 length:1194 start_codon:yes stop_codon:yes gene_type:complete
MPFLGNTPSQGFTNSVTKDDFNPNGSTTAFTLSKASNTNNIEVYVGNVRQEPTSAYSVSGTTLTMTEAPATGTNFYVMHESGSSAISLTPAAGTSVPGAFSVSGALTTAGFTSTGIDDNATSNAITIDANENVGIGVTPETDWHSGADALQLGTGASIYGDTTATGNQISANARATAGSSLNGYKYISTDKASTYHQYDGVHNFRVAASGSADAAIVWTTAMTIANTGSISISGGVTAPVGGWVNIRRPDNNIIVETRSFDTSGQYHLACRTAANAVVGGISVSGSTTNHLTSSDYRLKTDVQPMTGATARVKLLKPCNFEWIVDGTRMDGFLAHEAQEVVPESVQGTKDAMRNETDQEGNVTSVPDMQGIDQSKLVPLLVKTIQELEARITALEDA